MPDAEVVSTELARRDMAYVVVKRQQQVLMPEREFVPSDLTARDLAYVIFKRKYQIAAIFIVTMMLATIGAYLSPRDYVATATVYVVRNLPPVAASAPTTLSIVLDRKEVLNSEVDLIMSRAMAEQVANILASNASAGRRPPRTPPAFVRAIRSSADAVRAFVAGIGLIDAPPDEREGYISSLQQAIEAKPALNSDFITITGTADDPQYAALLVNTFTQAYLERRLTLFKRPGLEEFYDEQIRRARATVDDLEEQIKKLKTTTGVVTEDEQLRLKLQELSALNSELNQARSETRELEERTAALRARTENQPDAILSSRVLQRNPAVVDLEKKSVDLQAERALELNRFQGSSPVIQDLDRSIERLQKAAENEPATVVGSESTVQNTVRTTLLTELYRAESDQLAKQARERTLIAQIEDLSREIQSLDSSASELRTLASASASASKTYATYVQQREEARIQTATDADVTNLHVINRATPPSRPKYPRLLTVLIGAAVGLFLGFGCAFVSELFSHALNRKEDIERELELPVLAAMPDLRLLRQPF
ncbi:MAG TPA: Wzz/FepE/Etk N-terminal domain-containing protein [Vicinamibacterales bacterium]